MCGGAVLWYGWDGAIHTLCKVNVIIKDQFQTIQLHLELMVREQRHGVSWIFKPNNS